ncbi:MAG: DUF4330 domain-containing protein, partial [Candidatus Omnitrophica bacterium]|nr:DUF4330 domain-containing protein [Candidatus Omnitrophota bacterium]
MKIIDERGRFFGKINIIDFLVIVLLLCILPVGYFGYKILTKEPEVTRREFIEIERGYQLIEVKPEVLSHISVGDKELGWNGEVIGEIVSLGQSEPYKYKFDIGKGQEIIRDSSYLKQLKARLKLKVAVQKDILYYKDKIIKIGLPLEFKTSNYILTAVSFSEEEEEKKETMIDLYVTLKDLDEDIIREISVGDKEVNENGEVIAEILSLGKIENSSLELNLGGGNFVMGEDGRKRQISTKMRLKCQVQVKDDNKLYFKDKEVENNILLEFETDNYKVKGLVAKTFEITALIKEKWISLRVKFSGVLPEVATAVQKGDIEKDAFEKTVARISTVISNNPSQVLTLKDDEFITLSHPFQRDILSSLD